MIHIFVGAALVLALPAVCVAVKVHLAAERRRLDRGLARTREMTDGLDRYDEIRASEGDEAADTFAARLRERFKDRP